MTILASSIYVSPSVNSKLIFLLDCTCLALEQYSGTVKEDPFAIGQEVSILLDQGQ